MFNLSGSEIIVILLLALVVLGPEKLPEAVRRAGKAYSELRRMASSFQSEMRSVIDEPMNEMRETADMLRDATDFSGDDKRTKRPASSVRAKPAAARPPANEPPRPSEGQDAPVDDDQDLINRTLSGDTDGPSADGEEPTG